MSSIPIIIKMTLFNIIKQVLSSWQVIAVTLAIVIYFSIVSYAARRHYRRSPVKKAKTKVNLFKKKKPKADAVNVTEESSIDSNAVDELGIEES
jgi:positive regulator of sigma E activity